MRRLLNKLSIAGLVLALIVAPLQAAPPPAPVDKGDCPMLHAARQVHTGMHHTMGHDNSDHGTSVCPGCADQGCDDGHCDGSGCCTPHFQFCVNTAPITSDSGPADTHYPDTVRHLVSLPPSPLYRPPV